MVKSHITHFISFSSYAADSSIQNENLVHQMAWIVTYQDHSLNNLGISRINVLNSIIESIQPLTSLPNILLVKLGAVLLQYCGEVCTTSYSICGCNFNLNPCFLTSWPINWNEKTFWRNTIKIYIYYWQKCNAIQVDYNDYIYICICKLVNVTVTPSNHIDTITKSWMN